MIRSVKYAFRVLTLLAITCAFSQEAERNTQHHLLEFKHFELDENTLNRLNTHFDSKKTGGEELLAIFYGDDMLSNLEDWYWAHNAEELSIVPIRQMEMGSDVLYEYYLRGFEMEDFIGDVRSVRLLSNSRWMDEVFFYEGDNVGATFSQTSVTSSIADDTLRVTELTHQESPGLLYYMNSNLDVGLTAHLEWIQRYSYFIAESQIKYLSKSNTEDVRLEYGEEIVKHLEENKNLQYYIDKTLDFEEIDSGHRYEVIEALLVAQNELKPEAEALNRLAYVVGDQIWVRAKPVDGEVVMKLNDGDLCILLEKGQYQEIRNMTGHWYKINYEGQEGWIYGAQLDLPASETINPTKGKGKNSLGESMPQDDSNSQERTYEEKNLSPNNEIQGSSVDLTIFIVFFGLIALTIFAFVYFLIRFYLRGIRDTHRGQIDVSQFNEAHKQEKTSQLKAEISRIVDQLEFDRQETYRRSKRAFWGAVRNIFLFLILCEGVYVAYLVYQADSLEMLSLAGLLVPVAAFTIIAFFLGGMYWMLRGSRIFLDYASRFKSKLVAPMLEALAPDLEFKEVGLSRESYLNADIFQLYNHRYHYKSSDSIVKNNQSESLIISEVEHRNEVLMGANHPQYHIKDLATGNKRKNIVTFSAFQGFFCEIAVDAHSVKQFVKILPSKEAEYHHEDHLLNEKRKVGRIEHPAHTVRISLSTLDPQHRRDNGKYLNGKFNIYAPNESDVSVAFNPNFLKLMNYMVQKFGEEKVYVSITNQSIYLALDLGKDLFEPATELKKPLRETNVVERIYEDLAFIQQLCKELEAFKLTLK